MALALGNSVIVSGNGNSDTLVLSKGKHALVVKCGTWGSSTATLKVGVNGTFSTALQGTEEVVITANTTLIVAGGLEYYLLVASYSAPITLEAVPSSN